MAAATPGSRLQKFQKGTAASSRESRNNSKLGRAAFVERIKTSISGINQFTLEQFTEFRLTRTKAVMKKEWIENRVTGPHHSSKK
jgi:hypothetical protein